MVKNENSSANKFQNGFCTSPYFYLKYGLCNNYMLPILNNNEHMHKNNIKIENFQNLKDIFYSTKLYFLLLQFIDFKKLSGVKRKMKRKYQ